MTQGMVDVVDESFDNDEVEVTSLSEELAISW
jgi:hypothetical protein